MCVCVVTCSAQKTHRGLRYVSHEIDAHIVGPKLLASGSLSTVGVVLRTDLCRYSQRTTIRDKMGKQTAEMFEHIGWSVNSRSQEAQEADARGEDVRCPSGMAGESEGWQVSKLAGKRHRDSEQWPKLKHTSTRASHVETLFSRDGAGSSSYTVDRGSTRGVLLIVHG